MSLDNIDNSTEAWNQNSSFEQESVKEDVFDILSIEPCPNCSKDMISWKCSDSEFCWYWHWQDYLDSIVEKRVNMSQKMKWNWERIELKTISWNKFYYYDYHWRINETHALIEVKIWKIIYRVDVKYEILNKDDVYIIKNIFIDKIEKRKNIRDSNWNRKKIWEEKFFDYKEMKKYMFTVLSDYKFNKFFNG